VRKRKRQEDRQPAVRPVLVFTGAADLNIVISISVRGARGACGRGARATPDKKQLREMPLIEMDEKWETEKNLLHVEVWKYDPALFAEDRVVDPVSITGIVSKNIFRILLRVLVSGTCIPADSTPIRMPRHGGHSGREIST
jgi:hypothetical protein